MAAGLASPPVLIDLIKWMSGMPDSAIDLFDGTEPERFDDCQMFVLTTVDRRYGALALFTAGIPERICDMLGEGYYAVPKSINEFLIVPDRVKVDVKWLAETAARANSSLTGDDDRVPDVMLYFDADRRSFVSNGTGVKEAI